MSYIEQWNSMPAKDAATSVLPCCGSRAWADALQYGDPCLPCRNCWRPSDSAWWSLGENDWQEAFDSHPRIGEQHAQGAATTTALRWSGTEQGTAMTAADAAKAKLAEGNRAYETKFGRTFIVCATGKTSDEILRILERRMHHTGEAELQEAAEQQREITHIRLRKWLTAHEGAAG